MIRILFLVIFGIVLWVPLFNKSQPALFGFPFFYWYQMLVVLVSAALIFVVFLIEDKPDAPTGTQP